MSLPSACSRLLAGSLASLACELAGRANVLIVYIAEAHAADQWPINSTRYAGPGNEVAAPRSLAERRAVARRMRAALPVELDCIAKEEWLDLRRTTGAVANSLGETKEGETLAIG